MLQASGLQYGKKLECCASPTMRQEAFDDFDKVIEEVSNTPFHSYSQ